MGPARRRIVGAGYRACKNQEKCRSMVRSEGSGSLLSIAYRHVAGMAHRDLPRNYVHYMFSSSHGAFIPTRQVAGSAPKCTPARYHLGMPILSTGSCNASMMLGCHACAG